MAKKKINKAVPTSRYPLQLWLPPLGVTVRFVGVRSSSPNTEGVSEGKEPLYTNKNKYWVVGFTDGEACFNLDVHVKNDMRYGLQLQPEFTIVQHERDKELLEDFIVFFGCGSVGVNRKDQTSTRYHYRVKNVKDLHEKVVPFFEAHPLCSKKNQDFQQFKEIVTLMYSGYHRESLKNFLEIVDRGVELSKRSSKRFVPSTKRGKVNTIVSALRIQLQSQLSK
jgi:hypothetical protein